MSRYPYDRAWLNRVRRMHVRLAQAWLKVGGTPKQEKAWKAIIEHDGVRHKAARAIGAAGMGLLGAAYPVYVQQAPEGVCSYCASDFDNNEDAFCSGNLLTDGDQCPQYCTRCEGEKWYCEHTFDATR